MYHGLFCNVKVDFPRSILWSQADIFLARDEYECAGENVCILNSKTLSSIPIFFVSLFLLILIVCPLRVWKHNHNYPKITFFFSFLWVKRQEITDVCSCSKLGLEINLNVEQNKFITILCKQIDLYEKKTHDSFCKSCSWIDRNKKMYNSLSPRFFSYFIITRLKI